MSIAHGIDDLSRLLDGRDLQLTGSVHITAPGYLIEKKLIDSPWHFYGHSDWQKKPGKKCRLIN